MTYVTGQPIIFVGCGQVGPLHIYLLRCADRSMLFPPCIPQTYTDLRQLRVANVVQAILSD